MATPEIFALNSKTGEVTLKLAKGLYPMDAVYGAAYVLIDQAYVLLDKDGDGNVLVHVSSKEGKQAEKDLQKLAGTFANEALSQVLRAKLMKAHKGRLEAIVTQAVAGSVGIGSSADFSLDVLDDDDDDLDFLDDPLGIAVPWEEKFKGAASEERPDTRDGAGTQKQPGPPDSGGFQPVKPEGPSDS
jgi:His-Xaa-Ser system protein HxsD